MQLERQRRRVAGLVLDAERLERDREAQRSRVQREIERRRIEAEARCVEPDRRGQGGAEQVAARRAKRCWSVRGASVRGGLNRSVVRCWSECRREAG